MTVKQEMIKIMVLRKKRREIKEFLKILLKNINNNDIIDDLVATIDDFDKTTSDLSNKAFILAMIFKYEDYDKTLYYLKLSAKYGNIKAHKSLGRLYFHGDHNGDKIDFGRSLYHFEKSLNGLSDNVRCDIFRCDKFQCDILIYIGKIYLIDGLSLHNNKKAYLSFQKALRILNDPEALWQYGRMIFNGQYIQSDKHRALKYLRKSASLGNKDAQEFIDRNYY